MLVDCKVCKGSGMEDVGGHERVCSATGCILGKVESTGIVLGRIPILRTREEKEKRAIAHFEAAGGIAEAIRGVDPFERLCPYPQAHPSGCTCEGLEGI